MIATVLPSSKREVRVVVVEHGRQAISITQAEARSKAATHAGPWPPPTTTRRPPPPASARGSRACRRAPCRPPGAPPARRRSPRSRGRGWASTRSCSSRERSSIVSQNASKLSVALRRRRSPRPSPRRSRPRRAARAGARGRRARTGRACSVDCARRAAPARAPAAPAAGASAHGLAASASHTASARRPPGRSTRRVSSSAASGSAISMYPQRHSTASTLATGRSIHSAFHTWNSTLVRASSAARARAPSSIASAWSERITPAVGGDQLGRQQADLAEARRQLQHALAGPGVERLDHPVRHRRAERAHRPPAGAPSRSPPPPSARRCAAMLGARARAVPCAPARRPWSTSVRSGVGPHRSSRRSSLPERVRGSGPATSATPWEPCREPGARRSARAAPRHPVRRHRVATTSAVTASPQRSSARPTTAASSTPGCSSSTASTSVGATFSPPLTIVSAFRPVTCRSPSPFDYPIARAQPSVRARSAARDGRAGDFDLPVGAVRTRVQNSGGPAVALRGRGGGGAGGDRAAPEAGSRERGERHRGHLRAGLGQPVGEAHGHARRARPLQQRRGHGPAAGERAAQGWGALQAGVEQAGERGGHERDERHSVVDGLQQRAQRELCVEALVHHRGRAVDRAAQQDREPADVRERQVAQPPLARVEDRSATAEPSALHRKLPYVSSTGLGAEVVPEVWITAATASRSCVDPAPAPVPARRAHRGTQRLLHDDRAPSTIAARSRSPRRRSTGTATAPSSRQACSAHTKSRPAGSAMRHPLARRTPRVGQLRRARARARAAAPRRSRPRAGVSTASAAGAARRRPLQPRIDRPRPQASLRRGARYARRRRAEPRAVSPERCARSEPSPCQPPGSPPASTPTSATRSPHEDGGDREDHDRPAGGAQRVPTADRDRDLARAHASAARTSRSARSSSPARGRTRSAPAGTSACAADSGYLAEDDAGNPDPTRPGRFHVTDLHVQIRRLPKPVVAMVAGYAIGGGHVLHLVCDLTIAADNARFGQVGPRVGSFDGGFGAGLLARRGAQEGEGDLVPVPPVRRREALEMGLVNTVVPLERLEEETVRWCREMLALSPFALRLLKASLQRRRRRPRRHPAACARCQPALLRQRGGTGGPRRLPREAHAGLLALPAACLREWSADVRGRRPPRDERRAHLGDGRARAHAARRDRAGAGRHLAGARRRPLPRARVRRRRCWARCSSRSAPTSPTTTPTRAAAPTPRTASARCASPRAASCRPARC